jgi:hypothetical protein
MASFSLMRSIMSSSMSFLMPSWNLSRGLASAVRMTCSLLQAFSLICSKKSRSSSVNSVPKRSLSTSMISESGTFSSLALPVPTSVGLFTRRASPSFTSMAPEKTARAGSTAAHLVPDVITTVASRSSGRCGSRNRPKLYSISSSGRQGHDLAQEGVEPSRTRRASVGTSRCSSSSSALKRSTAGCRCCCMWAWSLAFLAGRRGL